MNIDIVSLESFKELKLDRLGEQVIANFDFFASLDYCVATKKKLSDCFYFYTSSLAVLVSIEKKLFFKYANILSEIQTTGCSKSENSLFIDGVIDILKKQYHVQWISQTPTHCVFDCFPRDSTVIPFATYQLSLTDTEEDLFSKMNSKHRNVIRRAIKENVFVKFGKNELIDDYLRLDSDTWGRSGLSSRAKDYYISLVDNVDECFVAIAYDSLGRPQAGAIVPYTKQRAYYLHGCSSNNCILGSANLLQWEIIKKLKNESVGLYDFAGCRLNVDEGSKFQGIQRFKERFGGYLKKGYMFRIVFSNFYYSLYKKMLSFRHKKAYFDVIDQEKFKWVDTDISAVVDG